MLDAFRSLVDVDEVTWCTRWVEVDVDTWVLIRLVVELV